MTRKNTITKPYWEMNAKELAEATAEFDRPIDPRKLHPLTPEMAAAWERAKRKPGRPRVGQGVKVISLSVERGLLRDCDALAKRMGLRRSAFIDMSLRTYLRRMEGPAPRNARKRRRSERAVAKA
jgi:hypothetical protein